MKILIPTILSLLIILAAILWFFSGDISITPKAKSENEIIAADNEKTECTSPIPSEETVEAGIDISRSPGQPPVENEDPEQTPSSADISFKVESVKSAENIEMIEDLSAAPSETVIEKRTESQTVSAIIFDKTANNDSAEESSRPAQSNAKEVSNRISNTPEPYENVETVVKYDNESPDEYTLSSYESELESPEAICIPERNWPDSNRVRRELTDEIAIKYPYANFNKRKIVNNVWDVGEQLTFSVDYGFYRAGTATMSVMGTEQVNGYLCYNIKTEAKSNKFISSFYKVRDSVTSFIDVDGIFSRRFEKKLREGKYKSDRIVDFYPNRQVALNTREKYAIREIPLYTQDILSSLYLLRTFDLEVGKDETIDVYADGKVYPLKVIIHGIEKVRVPAGKFECFKVEPILKSEGIFRQKGKLLIWLTCDDLKLPVKMKSKVTIGSIVSKLEKYTTGVIE